MKKRYLLLAFIAALYMVPGCDDKIESNRSIGNAEADKLIFFKHHDSGLCFAEYISGQGEKSNWGTCVPCDSVENLLINK